MHKVKGGQHLSACESGGGDKISVNRNQGEGTKYQCIGIRGGKISVHTNQGATKFECTGLRGTQFKCTGLYVHIYTI